MSLIWLGPFNNFIKGDSFILGRNIEDYSILFGSAGVNDPMIEKVPVSSNGTLQFTFFERPNESFTHIVIDYDRVSLNKVQILRKFIFDRKEATQLCFVILG